MFGDEQVTADTYLETGKHFIIINVPVIGDRYVARFTPARIDCACMEKTVKESATKEMILVAYTYSLVQGHWSKALPKRGRNTRIIGDQEFPYSFITVSRSGAASSVQ